MLGPALDSPDPVIVFEHGSLYNRKGVLSEAPGDAADITRAAIRRAGADVSLIAYGQSVWTALEAADRLAEEHVDAEVLDLRVLRPLDREAVLASVGRTHRAVVIDEMWRTGSLAGELSALIAEEAFYELDAPVARVCSLEVPVPYAKHLEDAVLPSAARVVAAVKETIGDG
jgi:pyruvate dehydrogenase E1 component beta subunit